LHKSFGETSLKLPQKEYIDMHFVYGFCNRNGKAAVVEYQQYFLNHGAPH